MELIRYENKDNSKRLAGQLIQALLLGKETETKRGYAQDLEVFATYQGLSLEESVAFFLGKGAGAAHAQADLWKGSMIEQGFSPATINRRLSTIRGLVAKARNYGLISWNLDIKNVDVIRYRDTKGPGIVNIRKMLDLIKGQTKRELRDSAIIRLLYDVGLRRGEVSSLDWPEDIDIENKRFFLKGKGRKEKELFTMPETTAKAVLDWLEVRGEEAGPLFISLSRNPNQQGRLTGRSIDRNVIKPLARKIGIVTSPHKIRHTAITEAIKAVQQDEDLDLLDVKEFSRHKSFQTVLIYNDREKDTQGKVASLVGRGL